ESRQVELEIGVVRRALFGLVAGLVFDAVLLGKGRAQRLRVQASSLGFREQFLEVTGNIAPSRFVGLPAGVEGGNGVEVGGRASDHHSPPVARQAARAATAQGMPRMRRMARAIMLPS